MSAGEGLRSSAIPGRVTHTALAEREWAPIALGVLHTLAYCSFWIVMHLQSQAWASGQVLAPLDSYWRWFYSNIFSEDRVTAVRRSAEAATHPFLMLGSIAAISAVYLLLLGWIRSRPPRALPRLGLLIGLALMGGVPLLLLPNLLSGDVYSNIAFGRIATMHGGNPFVQPPSSFPSDPFYRFVNWKGVASVYGPGWIYPSIVLTVLINSLRPNIITYVLAYKVFALALHLANGWLIWTILRRWRPEQRAWGSALYLLNPLALIEFAGNAHNDVLMITFILLGILAHLRGHWYWTIAAFSLAVLTKWIALPLLPLYGLALLWESPSWQQRVWRAAGSLAIFAALCVGMYRPFWEGPRTLKILFDAPPQSRLINSLGDVVSTEIQRAMWLSGRWPNPALSDMPLLFRSSRAPISAQLGRMEGEPVSELWQQQRARFYSDRRTFQALGLLADANKAYVDGIVRAVALGMLLTCCLVCAAITRTFRRALECGAWIFFVYCAIGAVWVWPWYVTWFVALAALLDWRVTGRTALLFSLLAPLIYIFFPTLPEPVWWQQYRAVLVFVPPLLFAAWYGVARLRDLLRSRQPLPARPEPAELGGA